MFRDTFGPPLSIFQHCCLWDKTKKFSYFIFEVNFLILKGHFRRANTPQSNSSHDNVVFYWGWQNKIVIKSICILRLPPPACPQFGNSLMRQRNPLIFRFKVLYQSLSPLPRRPQVVQPLCQEIPVAQRTFLVSKISICLFWLVVCHMNEKAALAARVMFFFWYW